MTDAQTYRTAALAVSAALRDDDTSVRHHLHTLPPDLVMATCEAAILTMAELLREFLPPNAIARAIHEAQNLAHEVATEGHTP